MPIKKRRVDTPIEVPPFYYYIYLIVGEEELEYYKSYQPILSDASFEAKAGFHLALLDKKGISFSLIAFHTDYLDDSTIFHECLHAVHEMMDSRGIPIDKGNSEVVAYYQEWLVKTIKKEIEKRGYKIG